MKNATVKVLGIGVSGASELVRSVIAPEWVAAPSGGGFRLACEARSVDTASAPDPPAGAEIEADRVASLSATAMRWALRAAALDLHSMSLERVGIVLGFRDAGLAGMVGFAEEVRKQTPRFVSPLHFPNTVGNYPAGALARAMGTRGPNNTVASGPGSGLSAVVEACRHLQFHEADVMFAGSVECSARFSQELDADSDTACWFLLARAGAEIGGGVSVVNVESWSSGGLAGADPNDREFEVLFEAPYPVIAPGALRGLQPTPGAAGALALAAAIAQLRSHQTRAANSKSSPTTPILGIGCADAARASGEKARVRFEDRVRETFTEFVFTVPGA